MSVKIHRTASVSANAELGDEVVIGEHTIIRGDVHIGDYVEIGSNVVVEGKTTIGAGTKIFHCAAIGFPPQDLKYKGEPTELIIGENNIIREFTSLHRGTAEGDGKTLIGNGNLIMAYVHIAHDCIIGDEVILANATNLGGHTIISDRAILGGMVAVHQFVHIGGGTMVGASSLILQDVLPFALASGNPAKIHDVNHIGMRRRGFPPDTIDTVRKTIKIITRMGMQLQNAIDKVKLEVADIPEVREILTFIENRSRRGILLGEKISN